jgi:hypothetical protein
MSLMDFADSPAGCGRSVTEFWGWDTHEVQLRCPDEVDGEYEVLGGALSLNSTKHGHHGNLPLQRKIHMVEPGIEPGPHDQ